MAFDTTYANTDADGDLGNVDNWSDGLPDATKTFNVNGDATTGMVTGKSGQVDSTVNVAGCTFVVAGNLLFYDVSAMVRVFTGNNLSAVGSVTINGTTFYRAEQLGGPVFDPAHPS